MLISFFGKGQNTFHKIYTLGDTSVFFNSVLEKDSTYLVSGSIGRGGQRMNATLIQLQKNGNCIDTIFFDEPNYLDALGNSFAKIDTNIFGEYLLHYISAPLSGYNLYRHTITKYNSFTNIQSTNYLDTLYNGSFSYLNFPRMIMNNSDSTYFTSSSYFYSSLLDTVSNLPDNVGFFVIKFFQNNDSIIWMKRFTYDINNFNGPTMGRSNILQYDNGDLLIISFQAFNGLNEYAKVVFYKLDKFGNVIQTKYVQDTPYSRILFGSTFLNNKRDLLICYTNSELITPTVGAPYWGLTPAIARLDSNFNIIWKKDLGGTKFNPSQLDPGRLINNFEIIDDSISVGGYFRSEWIDQSTDISSDFVRIENRQTSNGNINWERDYWFYPEGSMNYNPAYEIRDVKKTIDGGFIFVGEINIWDSIIAGAPSQLGYVLKTNCLGFLEDPQVGFSAQNEDSMGVVFTNTSLLAGSYLWNFGDGTTLQTGEFTDSAHATVFHQYSDSGTYEVTLIGYGCNGANDTLRYNVIVPAYAAEPTDTTIATNPNITHYMALGPNPVKNGESLAVYVGNLPNENCTLSFYDANGKRVLVRNLPQGNTTYILVLPLSAGIYQAVLHASGKELEVQKVLVYS